MSDTNLDVLLSTFDRYKTAEGRSPRTIESTDASVRAFAAFIGTPFDVASVTTSHLRDYILHLQTRPKWESHAEIRSDKGRLSPFTIATHVRTIKSFWSWLQQEGFLQTDPLRTVRTPKTPFREVRIVSNTELVRLFDAIPGKGFNARRDRALVLALVGMGTRIGEITSLKTSDVDFEVGQIRVVGKGRKERRLFMSPTVFKAIHKYWLVERRQVAGEYFFCHRNGRALDRWYVNHQLHRYVALAGIGGDGISPHKLRHTYATSYLRNGGNVFTLQNILGHATLDMSRHYAQVANEDVEREMRAHSPVEGLGLKV